MATLSEPTTSTPPPSPRDVSVTLERWNRCFQAGITNQLSDELASHLYELGVLVYGKEHLDSLRVSIKKVMNDAS